MQSSRALAITEMDLALGALRAKDVGQWKAQAPEMAAFNLERSEALVLLASRNKGVLNVIIQRGLP